MKAPFLVNDRQIFLHYIVVTHKPILFYYPSPYCWLDNLEVEHMQISLFLMILLFVGLCCNYKKQIFNATLNQYWICIGTQLSSQCRVMPAEPPQCWQQNPESPVQLEEVQWCLQYGSAIVVWCWLSNMPAESSSQRQRHSLCEPLASASRCSANFLGAVVQWKGKLAWIVWLLCLHAWLRRSLLSWLLTQASSW